VGIVGAVGEGEEKYGYKEEGNKKSKKSLKVELSGVVRVGSQGVYMHDVFLHSDSEEFFNCPGASPDYSVTKQFRNKWKRYYKSFLFVRTFSQINLFPPFQK
jgi:hypothetical protein